MFYIVEQEDKLQNLEKLIKLGVFVDVISSNDYYHPKLTSTVAVYIRLIDSHHGYIIPINHDEGINVDKNRVYKLLSSASKLYTLDKKNLLYHFNLQDAIDISLLYSMTNYERLEYSRELPTTNYFYNKFTDFKNINQLIPLPKLYESSEKVYNKIQDVIKLSLPSGFDFYNKIATNVFYLLEQSGLGVYYEEYKDLFKPRNPLYNTVDNYFVEFDFDGYHLRLLSEQINYKLTPDSAHKQLAKHYFGTEDITEEQYLDAKQINFQAIYGKIPEEHKELDIFKGIQNYIDNMWSNFNSDGYVENPQSGKHFTKQLKEMHPAKLMIYMMQSLETSNNILILKEVLRYLQGKKTKVVLYTYDALLFDYSKEDGKETLEKLQEILETGKKYPVKFKFSKDLSL